MSSELLYTSAPKGLRQGSRGFCTVISSSGMPSNLATKLESLSGYRQMFAPESPEANQNPVANSHMTVTVGGQVTSILSRIVAYGTDYSGRTNKLAHHVVPDRGEMPPAGPAWLLQQAGLMRTQWDGNCQTTATGPTIPIGNITAAKCNTWEQLAGDAGWAGALAQAWSQRQSKPIWLVFRLEHQNKLLTLLNEAIALLPENERWKATFNTYATQLPPDVQCRVRCVVDGTQDARMAKARGTVITLGQANGSAPTNAWSEIARGNQRPAPSPQPTPTRPTIGPGKTHPRKSAPATAAKIPGLPPATIPAMPTTAQAAPPAHGAGRGGEPPAKRPPMLGDPQDYTLVPGGLEVLEDGDTPISQFKQNPNPNPKPKPKRSKALWIAVAAVLMLLLGTGTIAVLKRDSLVALLGSSNEDTGNESPTEPTDSTGEDTASGTVKKPPTKSKPSPTASKEKPPLLTVRVLDKSEEDKSEEVEIISEPDGKQEKEFLIEITQDRGKPEIVEVSFDKEDPRLTLDKPEVEFKSDPEEPAGPVRATVVLKIKGNEKFDPKMVTVNAKPKDSTSDTIPGTAKLLITDSGDLEIEIQDSVTGKSFTDKELLEGKTYKIVAPSLSGNTPDIACEVKHTRFHPPGDFGYAQGKLLDYKPKDQTIELLPTKASFAKEFLELSITVTYNNELGKMAETTEKRFIKDADKPVYRLRWMDATLDTGTKLVDVGIPNVAYNTTSKGKPELICQTNEYPPKDYFIKCNTESNLQFLNGKKAGFLYVWLGLEKTNQNREPKSQEWVKKVEEEFSKLHDKNIPNFKRSFTPGPIAANSEITITIQRDSSNLNAYICGNKSLAEKRLKTLKKPKSSESTQTPPTSPKPSEETNQVEDALVVTNVLMKNQKKRGLIDLRAYQIVTDEKIKPFDRRIALSIFGNDQGSFVGVDPGLKPGDLNSFPNQTPKWDKNPDVQEYRPEKEGEEIAFSVILDDGKIAVCYVRKIDKNKEEWIKELSDTRDDLDDLMSHSARLIAPQLNDTDPKQEDLIRKRLNGYGDAIKKNPNAGEREGWLLCAPPNTGKNLENARKRFFKEFEPLSWNKLKQRKDKFTFAAFKMEFNKIEAFKDASLTSYSDGTSNEFKRTTEAQMKAIIDKIDFIQKILEKGEEKTYDLHKTLVVSEKLGEKETEILKIPLKFKLKFE